MEITMIEKQIDHNEIISICAGAGYIATQIAHSHHFYYTKLFSSSCALFVLWLIYDPIKPTTSEWILAGLTGFFSTLIIDMFQKPNNLIISKLDAILMEIKK
jgi:hypothetical protein